MTIILPDGLIQATTSYINGCITRLSAMNIHPRLAIFLVGTDDSSRSYVAAKKRNAEKIGIHIDVHQYDPSVSEQFLCAQLDTAAANSQIHGMMVEMPLPNHFRLERVLSHIPFYKDVDGQTAENLGRIAMNLEYTAICPATPQACIDLCQLALPLAGKLVCVIGRGLTVGRPLHSMLINRDATVIVCHSKTRELSSQLRAADVIISATGVHGIVNQTNVRNGQLVIDAGISYVGDDVYGDVLHDEIKGLVDYYTPVPGGVGRLTSWYIFKNLFRAIDMQYGNTDGA